ncbi:hypothetical protein ACVWYH_004332 [Bradyrhizobium sp. GM24.11]
MITCIAAPLIASTLDNVAWPMCRARQNAVMAESNILARFWNYVGDAGEALEAALDRVAARRGIDISAIMLD